MGIQDAADRSAEYWYTGPSTIDHWFYGVFEGGGAKGVAYAGALRALKERKCWFRAVAGSSAGAITAALIAAGLDPDEMSRETVTGLKCFPLEFADALKRFTDTGGFLPSESLREWLDRVLVDQLKKTCLEHKGNVTFKELFTATNIELNVVATDLSLQRQIIFSHLETPNCAVAGAVVASSSIPFAFPSRLLRVPERRGEGEKISFHHTIVDGGVWANFPLFIFEDHNFRRFYDRKPEEVDRAHVLGFLLDRGREQEIPRGEEIEFEWELPPENIRAREWLDDATGESAEDATESSIPWVVWLLWPFAMLGRFVGGLEGGGVRGRWPRPRHRFARYLVEIATGFQGGINGNVWFWALCAALVSGQLVVMWWFWQHQIYPYYQDFIGFLFSAHKAEYLNWTMIIRLPFHLIGLLFGVVGIALLVLGACLSVLSLYAVHSSFLATRGILYGLVTTYVNAPGAPAWTRTRANIVALPISSDVTTLSFGMDSSARERLVEAAYRATMQKLDTLLLSK